MGIRRYWHFSPYERRKHDIGRCNYTPLNLGEVPDYYRRFVAPVDMVILKTCPKDENDHFNFGVANIWHRAVIERARMVVVEVNQRLPTHTRNRGAGYLPSTPAAPGTEAGLPKNSLLVLPRIAR